MSMELVGWPDSYCPKTNGGEHDTYYTAHNQTDVCRCGAKKENVGVEKAPPEAPPTDLGLQPGSQTTVLLEMLRRGAVCSFDFYKPDNPLTHRMAGRIAELRQKGLVIETRDCRAASHNHRGATAAVEYVLQ